MKYCTHCGNQLDDDATICSKCGCPALNTNQVSSNANVVTENNVCSNVAYGFMIFSTVVYGLLLIPLAWCLPMTIHYYKVRKNGESITIGFAVCNLLFCSTVAGILMLVKPNTRG